MPAKKFKRKPVEVEALQWQGHEASEPATEQQRAAAADAAWTELQDFARFLDGFTIERHARSLFIVFRGGPLRAHPGDYVVRYVDGGALFVLKADAFAAKYKAA
jgi:hypothetical protein